MSNYENGPEEIERIPRMPDAVLECIIEHSLFRYLANRYEGEDRDRLHGLMHDTAEEVLARVSIPKIVTSPANGAVGLIPSVWIAHARAAVLAERAACAAIADSIGGNATTGDQVADYIRARK